MKVFSNILVACNDIINMNMFSKYTGRRQRKSLKVLPYYHLLKCLKFSVAYAVSFEVLKGANFTQ